MNGKLVQIPLKGTLYEKWLRWLIDDKVISIGVGISFLLYRMSLAESAYDAWAEIVFVANYALLVYLINYVLLPHLFYKRQYLLFLVLSFCGILLAGILEEGPIEGWFFPEDRGARFDVASLNFVFFEILPIVIPLFGFKLAWDYHQAQINTERLQHEKTESELKFLKSQINPHVLFNNLNNIYSYSLENSRKVSPMILKLSDIMRYMLYECDGEVVPLRKELEYLTNYVELQKIQMEGRGEVQFRIIGNTEGYRIAPLILISFVENCFKHSMQTQVKGINIDIVIRIMEGTLDFFAENNYDPEAKIEDIVGGVGLVNVEKRLDILYKGRYQLRFDRMKNVFRVNLQIELV